LSSPELGKFSLERLQDVVNISKALGWAAPQETSSIIALFNDPAAMGIKQLDMWVDNLIHSRFLLYSSLNNDAINGCGLLKEKPPG